MKSTVLILYTGGTFGMQQGKSQDTPLVPGQWEDILRYMPAVNDNGYFTNFEEAQFTFTTLEEVVDSSHMNPDTWVQIAEVIEDNYDSHSGFIIIHGTDTLAYTASALSFMFKNLNKPIVITGSQLPVFHPRTDGIVNLSNAIYLAAYRSSGLLRIPEVCICFNDDVLRGNRSSKSSTFDFEGFSSPNCEHLGWLEQNITLNPDVILEPNEQALEVFKKFSSKVVNVTVFPGYDPTILMHLVETGQIEGIVLKTFGSGNVPTHPNWNRLIQSCEQMQVLILATTQCPNGSIEIGKYKASEVLISPVVINGFDITPEAALTKLMWVIGNFPYKDRAALLSQSLCGEMTIS